MKNSILIILFVSLISGCAPDQGKFDDIELAAFAWRHKTDTDSKDYYNWQLICKYYALIDRNYNCQLVPKGLSQGPVTKYYSIIVDKALLRKKIDDILKSSTQFETDLNLRPKRIVGQAYDGSDLIIQINKNGRCKRIYFWEGYNESAVYEQLYILIDSLFMSNSRKLIGDTDEISKRRQDFMKYTIKPDSLLKLLPPTPPAGLNIKYKAPIIVDNLTDIIIDTIK
jgi:hypothetical protein